MAAVAGPASAGLVQTLACAETTAPENPLTRRSGIDCIDAHASCGLVDDQSNRMTGSGRNDVRDAASGKGAGCGRRE